LNGIAHLLIGDSTVIFTNVIGGSGGFVWDAYNHNLTFTAANTYTGPTVIGSGLTLVLSGNGSISHSTNIFFGGSTTTNVSLDASGRSDQTLTLASGQTLGGVGAVNGALTISAGAAIAPAGTNVTLGMTEGNSVVGALAASGAVKLNGTTVIKLNGSGVNDVVGSASGITYGGTLNLVNISGAPYAAGNSFQIFSAASYGGNFAGIVPATPGAGLVWDTSQLNIGFLNVIAGSTPPTISSHSVVNGNLIFGGSGGPANGNYVVLSTTNAAAKLATWTPVITNSFDGSGNFSATNAIGTGQHYYAIKLLP
jgi:autotransporter-associated beta strand protein